MGIDQAIMIHLCLHSSFSLQMSHNTIFPLPNNSLPIALTPALTSPNPTINLPHPSPEYISIPCSICIINFFCQSWQLLAPLQMLPLSHKPEVLRLHELQSKERLKFTQNFGLALGELLPASANKYLKQSKILSQAVAALPDAYYSLVTLLLCRRKLGEEYTYIAMYKQKHYLEQGLLLNKKTRVLLFLLELLSRNLLLPLFYKLTAEQRRGFEENKPGSQKPPPLALYQRVLSGWQRVRSGLMRVLGSAEEIMSNVEWLILMVYMLDWNKHFTFIETLLGITYAYTYKNDQIRDVSYKVEGYLLLATFAVKAGKSLYAMMMRRQAGKEEVKGREMAKEKEGADLANGKEKGLCRICYDQLRDKSATKCGHTFCWSCIVKTLEMSQQCPVCRTHCLPREVVQLRNFA